MEDAIQLLTRQLKYCDDAVTIAKRELENLHHNIARLDLDIAQYTAKVEQLKKAIKILEEGNK